MMMKFCPTRSRVRRTMLHARALTLPREGKEPIAATAPLPADFRSFGIDWDSADLPA